MNQLDALNQRALCDAFLQGRGVREAARLVECAKGTAAYYRDLLVEHGILDGVRCPCGQEPGHRGWCSYRVARSGRRADFLREEWGCDLSDLLETRVRLVVDDLQRIGEPVTEKVVREHVGKIMTLSDEDADELVEAVGEHAMAQGISGPQGNGKPQPDPVRVMTTDEMVEAAAGIYARDPECSARAVYNELMAEHGRLPLKRTSWENGEYPRRARVMGDELEPDKAAPATAEAAKKGARADPKPPEPGSDPDSEPPRSADMKHSKIKIPREDIENMEPVKCAIPECGRVFMIDARDKAGYMENGDVFYCPDGCPNTYHQDKQVEYTAPDERRFVVSTERCQLSATPIGDDYERFRIEFTGEADFEVLLDLSNHMWDEMLRMAGVDPGELEPMRGTASNSLLREARDLRRLAEHFVKATPA